MENTLYIVVPCYNEGEMINESCARLCEKLTGLINRGAVGRDSRILFVNDGSSDDTWQKISALSGENNIVTGISLSHNSGEQNAYMAGMETALKYADVIITTDADLQDDINAMDEMLRRYHEGSDIVYGVRASRKDDPFFKRVSSAAFYRFMKLLGTELVREHSQYRLMSRRAVEALMQYRETDLFLPALVPLLGFKSAVVSHKRSARPHGESHYSFKKLLALATDAIVSFSTKPIKLIGAFSALSFLAAIAGLIYLIVIKCTTGTVNDSAVNFISIWLIGGLVLLSVRIVGEYVASAMNEAKRRPRYIIEEKTDEKADGGQDVKADARKG